MTFGFVDEHRHLWPVRAICAVLGVSVSGHSRLAEPAREHAEH